MTDSIRVPLGDEWRHREGGEQKCVADSHLWPCQAERTRLALDAATARALAAEEALRIDPILLGMAMDRVDEEDLRVGVVGRGRKVDRIIAEYDRFRVTNDG